MLIQFYNLTKQYNKNSTALINANFSIKTGVCGLLGRNGAGKTTLMRILATIIKPSSGSIFIDGININERESDLRSNLGYLPQSSSLQPNLTIEEYLDYIAILKGIENKKERMQQINQIIDIVGLQNQGKKKLKSYSGGMLRRAGIAQMLLGDPQLLIIDEPTSGLDPEERLYFKNLISRIGRNKTVLLSTHIISDIEDICDDVVILDSGEIKYSGSINDLLPMVKDMVYESIVEDEKKIEEAKTNSTVTAITYNSNEIRLRYIAEQPIDLNSEKKIATLEDAYLYVIGGVKR